MKIILAAIACLVMLGGYAGVAIAADTDLIAAIGKAGRQRMLSQRIVKAYAQVGQDVLPELSRTQLKDSVALFDEQLAELKTLARDDALKAALAEVETRWQPVRAVASGPVDRLGIERLVAADNDLLAAADNVTLILRERVGTPQSRLVNVAGRQRMVSQRVAKLYMLKAWGITSLRFEEEMRQSIAEFADALAVLRQSGANTPEIDRELESVAVQWEWFTAALELEGAFSYRLLIADASESILRSMEVITGLYERTRR